MLNMIPQIEARYKTQFQSLRGCSSLATRKQAA
jgi:hypothetical protein